MCNARTCPTAEIYPPEVTATAPVTGLLDTLPLTVELPNSGKLVKRALRKAVGLAQVKKLLQLNSPIYRQYERTLLCGSRVTLKNGEVKSQFCGKRWCPVCSANKQGEMINGYQQAFQEMQEPMFLTLTLPAVTAPNVKNTIQEMPITFRQIKDSIRKQGVKLRGIRKIECNYNPKRKTFNPHFHIIVEGIIEAETLVNYWLKYNTNTVPEAQNIQQADKDSLKELVKYTTKTIVGKKFYPEATDTINRALKGVRTFQAYGGIKKAKNTPEITPDPNEIETADTTLAPERNTPVVEENWWFNGNTWVNSEGYPLVVVEYTDNMERLLKNIRKAPLYSRLE